MDWRAPVVLVRVPSESEASVIRSLLAGYGIPCHYAPGLPDRMYPRPDGARIAIFVPAESEQEARDILGRHRRQP